MDSNSNISLDISRTNNPFYNNNISNNSNNNNNVNLELKKGNNNNNDLENNNSLKKIDSINNNLYKEGGVDEEFNENEDLEENDFKYNRDPIFNLGLRRKYRITLYLFDWFFCIMVVLIGGMLFYFVPVRGRLFRLDDPEISYPLSSELVPMGYLMFVSIAVPIFLILSITVLFTKNWHDFHHGQLGLVQSIAVTLLLVAIFKCFIGGLRPNFLSICKPTPQSIAQATPVGYNKIYYTKEVCTGSTKDVNDALSAYPSGHAGLAASGLAYLALYLNGKLKTFQNRGHLVIYVMVFSCVTSAGLVGVSRIADYRHTFLNVLAGWIIGCMVAISMYRLNFLSVFGVNNHIPVADFWFWHWKNNQNQNQIELDKQKENEKSTTGKNNHGKCNHKCSKKCFVRKIIQKISLKK
eukprot:gene11225-13751_t